METVKTYILSLTGFSFISSVVCALMPEMPTKRTVKFVCGIILCILIISPLKNINPQFSDIFAESESYNLYNGNSAEKLTESVLADKVSEVVGECFSEYGISGTVSEVVFDGEGNIVAVNINRICEPAAKKTAAILGLPYELMHMTE